MKTRVLLVVRNTPSVLPHFCRAMDAHGYSDEMIYKPGVVVQSFQQQAVVAIIEGKKSTEALTTHEQSSKGTALRDIVPSKHCKLNELSRNCFRDSLLPGVEPSTMSDSRLRKALDCLGVAASKSSIASSRSSSPAGQRT